MGEASSNHKILSELGALYCRFRWAIWPVAVEAVGLAARNYDVIAIKASPKAIVGMEVKISRKDFLAGIRKGHFDKSEYISELWLVYPGNFPITELPDYVGIMKPKAKPICSVHDKIGKSYECNDTCNNIKNVYLDIVKPAKYFYNDEDTLKYWNMYTPKWLWKIATSSSTKVLNIIQSNMGIIDVIDEESNSTT